MQISNSRATSSLPPKHQRRSSPHQRRIGGARPLGGRIRDSRAGDPYAARLRRDVGYFTTWLLQARQLLRAEDRVTREKYIKYIKRATRPVVANGIQCYPFAPIEPSTSAMHTFTNGQLAFLLGAALVWALGLIYFGVAALTATVALITLIYCVTLVSLFRPIIHSLSHSPEEVVDNEVIRALETDDWPRYTILCPLYKEANIVPQFVRAITALDYPVDRLEVLFLVEAVDTATREAIEATGMPPHFHIITVPDGSPRTKPRACNYGLLRATGYFVVIYDAEDIPDPFQLKKAILAFANQPPEVACIQAKLHFYNTRQNLLTRWFALEYLLWFELILPGLQASRLSMPLGGTSNHFRASVLMQLGAWDPFNVTEDCDLGLRLARMGLRTAMLDSVTYEEANSNVRNWIRQRSRWIKGYWQTYLVHMRRPWRFLNPSNTRELVSLQTIIAGTPATFFLNPFMWALVAVYIALHLVLTGEYHILYPPLLFYAGTTCLVFGNFFTIYAYFLAAAKREQYGLMAWAFLIPFYWALMCVAALVAFYQLIVKPHHWEKTDHGLHLTYAHDITHSYPSG